jgi:hypothetical protein
VASAPHYGLGAGAYKHMHEIGSVARSRRETARNRFPPSMINEIRQRVESCRRTFDSQVSENRDDPALVIPVVTIRETIQEDLVQFKIGRVRESLAQSLEIKRFTQLGQLERSLQPLSRRHGSQHFQVSAMIGPWFWVHRCCSRGQRAVTRRRPVLRLGGMPGYGGTMSWRKGPSELRVRFRPSGI